MRHFTLGLVAGLALATGCESSAIFRCQSEAQCTLDGKPGTCEPNGYCSFADPECPTGQRYGDQAPDGLAGLCVEPFEDDTEPTGVCVGPECAPTTSTTAPGTTMQTTGGESTLTDEGTGSSASRGTADDSPGSGSSSGSSSASSNASSGADGSTSSPTGDPTTTGVSVCPEFVDEFDNGIVDEAPWVVFDGTGMMSEAGSTMRFSIEPAAAFYSFMIIPGLDISMGYVVAHVVALPQDPSSEFLLRVFDAGASTGVELGLTGDRRLAARLNGVPVTEYVFGPGVSDIWLELVFDGTNVNFNFSTDGAIYTELESLVSPLVEPSAADVSMAAGSFSPIMTPAHTIEVNVFEYCSSPFDG